MRHFTRGAALGVLGLVILLTAACQTMTGRTAGGYIDDQTITAQVKARLAATQAETLTRVDVDTVNGTVYLNGVVADTAMRSGAEEIARTQEGVRRVVNNLKVDPAVPR